MADKVAVVFDVSGSMVDVVDVFAASDDMERVELPRCDGPTMVDLEDSGSGVVSWDLVPQLVAVRRFGASQDSYHSFCDAYGADLMTWDGAETFCRTFELLLLSWAIANRDMSRQLEAEAALRLANFRGETNQPWTLL